MSFANVSKKGQFEDVGTSSSVVHSAVEECKCVMLCVFLCSSPDQLVKPGWIQQGPWLLRRNSATPTWRGRGAGGWAARPSAANTISPSDLRISLQFNSSANSQRDTSHVQEELPAGRLCSAISNTKYKSAQIWFVNQPEQKVFLLRIF